MAESKQVPVAAVLGVGPGLGAALARRFAQGYAVAINARSAEYLRSLAGEIRAAGGQVFEVPADLGARAQVEAVFKSIRERLGPPEVLLYNAGSGTWGTITEITPEQYENARRVNAYGAFLSAKEVAPDMIARGRGVMLFTGTTAGVKAGPKSLAFGPRPSSRCAGSRKRWRATSVPRAFMSRGSTSMGASTSQAGANACLS